MQHMKHTDKMAGWVAVDVSGKKMLKGSAREVVWEHNRTYPQHPLCKKRNYWRVLLEAKRGKYNEPYINATLYLCTPGEEDYILLYTVKIEEEDLGPEQTDCTYHLIDTVNLFDLVSQVFGDGIEDYWKREGDVHVFILVQEVLHVEDSDYDWEIVQQLLPRARMIEKADGTWELEVVQIIAENGSREYKYIPMTKYPQP